MARRVPMANAARDRARAARADMGPEARALWQILRAWRETGRGRFRRQAPIGPVRADFAEFEKRLAILIVDDAAPDPRAAWLEADGFRVLSFPRAVLVTEAARILRAVEAACAAPPPPAPPHKGEGRKNRGRKPPSFPSPLVGEGQGGGRDHGPEGKG